MIIIAGTLINTLVYKSHSVIPRPAVSLHTSKMLQILKSNVNQSKLHVVAGAKPVSAKVFPSLGLAERLKDLIICYDLQEYKLFEQALKATPSGRWSHAGEMKPNGSDYASLDI